MRSPAVWVEGPRLPAGARAVIHTVRPPRRAEGRAGVAVGRERALEIVEHLVSSNHEEEAEGDALLDELERLVPDPRVSDLI